MVNFEIDEILYKLTGYNHSTNLFLTKLMVAVLVNMGSQFYITINQYCDTVSYWAV